MQNSGEIPEPQPIVPVAALREKKIIWLFCALAAVHIFVFSAAIPPISNVDEFMHFDLAVKYSHGHFSRGMEPMSPEAMDYIALYGSQEFLWSPDSFPGNKFPPPPWTQPMNQIAPILLARESKWQTPNYESSQPPLYYLFSGFCWRAGQWLGLQNGGLFYWLRFVNILPVIALIWLGYVSARIIFPENAFLRIGVPALLAFMPQSAFYLVENDVFSPFCFGAAFICLIRLLCGEQPDVRIGICAGLALAATFLTKMTNVSFLAVAFAAVFIKMLQLAKAGKLPVALPSFTSLFAVAVPPMTAWALWCKVHFGDFTGSTVLAHHWGWTVKPVSQWLHHPMFTPAGFWAYLSGQMGTFWQGEISWYRRPMAFHGTYSIYTIFSIVLMIAALPALFQRPLTIAPMQRYTLQFGLACVIAGLAFYAWGSIRFDFQNGFNPSRDQPYFHAGRILLGMLIPFLLLLVYGLDRLLGRLGLAARFIALAAVICAMMTLEIFTDLPFFSSQYNWYHLP